MCVVHQIGCVELHDIAVGRDPAVVLIRHPLKERSLKAGDSGKTMAFGCSARVKRDCSKLCGVLDDAADW